MKTISSKLVLLLLLGICSQHGYSQDSISVNKWQLKITYQPQIPDSFSFLFPYLKENSEVKENPWSLDKSPKLPKLEIVMSIFFFRKNNNFYILKRLDTLIAPPAVNDNSASKEEITIIKIDRQKKNIYFFNAYQDKSMADSIFPLDDNLITIDGEKSKFQDLYFYKNGNVEFSSTAKLNSIYDLFDNLKYIKITHKGDVEKHIFMNVLKFVSVVKIKNIEEEIKKFEKSAKFKSKTKKAIFDDFFVNDKK